MHCYICDREDESITFDKKDGRFCPCRTCQAIIFESLLDDDDDSVHIPGGEDFVEGPPHIKGRINDS